MTTVATAEQPKVLEMTFELVDTKPSAYVMDGPGVDDIDNLDFTPVISFPSLRMIRNTSRVKVIVEGKDGNPPTFYYKKIRYIKGCPILDVQEQEEKGYKPNHLTDLILFRSGHIKAVREGDVALYDYLMQCEYNINADNRPDDAEDVFKQLSPILDAEGEEAMIDLQADCLRIIQALKLPKAGGAKGFQYNEDALQFYCSLFKLPAFDSGYGSEAWVALANFATEFPARFLNSIASARSIIEADVFNATLLGVINIDNVRAFFTEDNTFICEVQPGLNADERGQAMVDFMSNPKNRNHYDTLRVRVQNAKAKKTEVIK